MQRSTHVQQQGLGCLQVAERAARLQQQQQTETALKLPAWQLLLGDRVWWGVCFQMGLREGLTEV